MEIRFTIGSMENYQHIDASRFRIQLEDTDDPVAQRTEWSPLAKGGASFRTRRLKQIDQNNFAVVATTGSHFFNMVFILCGLGALGASFFAVRESILGAAVALVVGSVFVLIGGFMAKMAFSNITLDLYRGLYYTGRSYDPYKMNEENKAGSLSEIYALQIVREYISSSDSNYTSYELNLVLNDGRRVNIMDHGKLSALREDARLLSDALSVPVWDASGKQ